MARRFNEHGIMKLTPNDVARLNRVANQTTAEYEHSKVTYPKRSELVTLKNLPTHELDRHVRALGFSQHSLLTRPEDLDFDFLQGIRKQNRRSRRMQAGKRGRQPNSGLKNSTRTGGGRSLPNADHVHEMVLQIISASNAKPVSATGAVVWGELNFEMLTLDKAHYFGPSYQAIIQCAHIWLCAEVSQEGLQELAKMTGYTAVVSTQNNRGQCVGILIHPGLTLLGPAVQDNDVATVHGVAELRPSLLQNIRDWKGNEFFACAIHLKSMRGGEASTAAIRYAQCVILAAKLKGRIGIIGGDWNCKLRSTKDIQPLLNIGGVLAGANDHRSTQAMGGDLDGFVQLLMKIPLGPIEMLDWLSVMGRLLTDHNAILACAA